MTRRDFELVAETLRYCAGHCDSEAETAIVAWVTEKFAEKLATTNPRFDAGRFTKAASL
jgi:hypothetical protein